MRLYLLLLLIPFTNPPIAYRQLTWSDFKGKPTNDHAASTCTGIVIEKDTAYAIFEPDKSWTRTASEEVLKHEQLHFAITEYWADKINRWNNYKKNGHRFNDYIPYYFEQWELMEQRYDAETNHGTDTAVQKRWEELIKL